MATGAVWAGNPTTQLGALQDYDQTLEPKEMCDNGTTFLRWFAIENNTLSGAVVDTDLSGATYTVVGTPSFGACVIASINIPILHENQFIVFNNLGEKRQDIKIPFQGAREIHLQGNYSTQGTQIVIEYTTTLQPIPQFESGFMNGVLDIDLADDRGFFNNVTIYTVSGIVGKGIINFIN